MLVLAEIELILFTVVPVAVRDLSMLCHVGGVGPQPRQLTGAGQWDIHSIPCDAMTSILMGAVGMCGLLWLRDWLGLWLHHVLFIPPALGFFCVCVLFIALLLLLLLVFF